jgi:hypothetical protein
MMRSTRTQLSRKDFLKLSALALGGAVLAPLQNPAFTKLFKLPDFPDGERLGRVCYGKWDLKARPDQDSRTVGSVMDDAVLPWIKEAIGTFSIYRNNKRWVETPQGYIWGAYFQPVRNQLNQPVESLPETSIGTGMWAEVTVPYVDAILINPPPRHHYFRDRYENTLPLRFYYSQILWVDQVRQDPDGDVFYRVNEKYGNLGDLYWCDARAFRPLTKEELEPISPEVEDKRIVVDIAYKRQYMSCYEGNSEVYFSRISSGIADGSTPLGEFAVYRKLVSLHMSGGTAVAGWDTGGVGWTNLFTGQGVAIHSTYWHNNFGEPESNGCVNVTPQDAQWIFRWSNPAVGYDPGDRTITDFSGTRVLVKES